jgi:hypothetical protein
MQAIPQGWIAASTFNSLALPIGVGYGFYQGEGFSGIVSATGGANTITVTGPHTSVFALSSTSYAVDILGKISSSAAIFPTDGSTQLILHGLQLMQMSNSYIRI